MQHPSSWGFPLPSFQWFSSAPFLPLQTASLTSFVLLSPSSFTPTLRLIPFSGVLFRFCDVVPDLVSVSPSSRQMADLGVMVRCLGGVDSLQGEGFYISRRSVRENPCLLSVFSFPRCYTLRTSLHTVRSPWPSSCVSSVHTYVCVFVLVCVCLFSDRMGFCGDTAPRVRLGTDWCLSLHVLTH